MTDPTPIGRLKTTKTGKQLDFVLYKVTFAPMKFNYWNKWYKKLAKKVFGPRAAYWLFYRNALKIKYSGWEWTHYDGPVREG